MVDLDQYRDSSGSETLLSTLENSTYPKRGMDLSLQKSSKIIQFE